MSIKEGNRKKKASTKRNTKPVIREPEFDKTPDTNERCIWNQELF